MKFMRRFIRIKTVVWLFTSLPFYLTSRQKERDTKITKLENWAILFFLNYRCAELELNQRIIFAFVTRLSPIR